MNEVIVFFMREFKWTYEYTRDLVGNLPIEKLNALIAETQYQKAMDDYNLKMTIYAAATNPHTKRPKSAKALFGNPPTRGGEDKSTKSNLKTAASKLGITMPEEGK